jgi:hypothetical protein
MKRSRSFLAFAAAAFLFACSDDEGTGGSGGSGPGSGGGSPGSGGTTGTGGAGAGGGELGPTAQIRIVNLVEGLTFDAWGADVNNSPVRIAEGLAFESISGYIDAPLYEVTMSPELVLMPAGEVPEDTSFWMVDNSTGPDRAYVKINELDAANERATIIVRLDDFTDQIQWEQLDETELMLGEPASANLHISYELNLEGTVVPAFSVAGEPCLFTGTTGVAQAWPVTAGTFDVGVYDTQTVAECTTELATTSITAAAADQVLVAVYNVDADVRFLTAPIEP